MALKISQLLNNKSYEHIHIKRSLMQYIAENIAMHTGVKTAVAKYFRLKMIPNFIVPSLDVIIHVGRQLLEQGRLDDAIIIFKAVITEFPEFWKAYDALGEAYFKKGDTISAIQSFKKSLELNPQNHRSKEILKKLE